MITGAAVLAGLCETRVGGAVVRAGVGTNVGWIVGGGVLHSHPHTAFPRGDPLMWQSGERAPPPKQAAVQNCRVKPVAALAAVVALHSKSPTAKQCVTTVGDGDGAVVGVPVWNGLVGGVVGPVVNAGKTAIVTVA
jgi:hypothetical protein